MAVSNPASFASIIAEFGGSGSFRDYYRGGPYVPNAPANQNISTDPNTLSMAAFAGAVRAVPMSVSISPATLSVNNTTGTATCNITGGIAPFSFSWTYTYNSGSGGTMPSFGSTTNQTCGVSAGGNRGNCSITLYCTVTDSAGTQAQASIPCNIIKTTG
jgi:hypothetical protein